MYFISTDKEKFDLQQIKKLLGYTSWAKEWTEEKIKNAMEHSVVYGAFEKNTGVQIALARVVTDYTTLWYLCDVVVDIQHRNRGVAKMLVDYIVADPRFEKIEGMLITVDAHGLYKKCGFESRDGLFMNRQVE